MCVYLRLYACESRILLVDIVYIQHVRIVTGLGLTGTVGGEPSFHKGKGRYGGQWDANHSRVGQTKGWYFRIISHRGRGST